MAVATGLFEFTKLKHGQSKNVAFRNGWKRRIRKTLGLIHHPLQLAIFLLGGLVAG